MWKLPHFRKKIPKVICFCDNILGNCGNMQILRELKLGNGTLDTLHLLYKPYTEGSGAEEVILYMSHKQLENGDEGVNVWILEVRC